MTEPADLRAAPARARAVIAGLVLVVAVFAVARALFGAYFMLDDYGMLAIARFVDMPLQYFVADHIPGSLYYRPLGMLVWWITERAFGSSAALHYAVNLSLHAAVTVLLGQILTKAGLHRGLSFLLALAFALHPVSIGTAAWLSDRFDLLAALFGLLALRVTMTHSASLRAADVAMALAWLALALLSKEVALSFAAALFVTWAVASGDDWQRRRWLIALVVLVLAYLAVRGLIIADAGGTKLFKDRTPLQAFGQGMGAWLQGGLAHLGHWQRLGDGKRLALVLGSVVLAVALLVALPMTWHRARIRLVLVGTALFSVPALLQWPLLAAADLRVEPATSIVLLVVNSRHFYAAGIGLALIVGGLLMPLGEARAGFRAGVAVAIALLVVPWLGASQRLAVQHRNETRVQGERVAAANAAIGRAALPRPCRIFLLGSDDWSFRWISDEAIKGTIADADFARVSACLIQAEHTPWYHIVPRGSVDPTRLAPLALARGLDVDESRLRIGTAEMLVLNLDARIDPREVRDALFLVWRDGRFVDAGAEIESGTLPIAFSCNRRASQCAP